MDCVGAQGLATADHQQLFSFVNRTAMAARLADLQARSEPTDRTAASALEDLTAAGMELAAAMAVLAAEMELGR